MVYSRYQKYTPHLNLKGSKYLIVIHALVPIHVSMYYTGSFLVNCSWPIPPFVTAAMATYHVLGCTQRTYGIDKFACKCGFLNVVYIRMPGILSLSILQDARKPRFVAPNDS